MNVDGKMNPGGGAIAKITWHFVRNLLTFRWLNRKPNPDMAFRCQLIDEAARISRLSKDYKI